MPLTMKELDQRLTTLEDPLYDLEVDDELYARVSALETFFEAAYQDISEEETAELDAPPEWVRPLIEALLGVRLGRAHEYAIALQGKYYPTNLVEGTEVLPNG